MAYFYGMKHLRDLFPEHPDNPEIRNLCINSQDVKPGDLFICTKGATTDRHDFVLSAVKNGAAAVVASRPIDVSVPVVYVNNTNEAMPHLAATLYEHPDNKMNLTAVTGTNGKTTAATILSEMMGQEWFGYIGTNGVASSIFREPIRNTCPDADRMYLYLRQLADAGCTSVVLEATSEALLFGRLDTFGFDTVIFTNITQDHLNTHKTIENYVKAKLHLLDLLKKDATVILNADDKYFEREKTAAGEHRIISYGMAEKADLRIESIECRPTKTILKVTVRGNLGVKVFTVKKELLDVGKEIIKNSFGHEIPIYNRERTICDLVRSRSRFEIQDYQTALKTYIGGKGKDLNRLMEYAKLFHVDKKIRDYMEVML